MNRQILCDAFQGLVPSGPAVLNLNSLLGTVLEMLTFQLSGVTKSQITNIVLKANNKPIWETTGARLDARNQYHVPNADATILVMDFMDRRAITPNAKQAGALDLSLASGIKNLRLEITTTGAAAPVIVTVADVSPPSNSPWEDGIRGLIARTHGATQVIGGAGIFPLQIPHIDPSGGGSNYRRLYLYSANMTAFKCVREGQTDFEISKLVNEASQKRNLRTPQASLVVIDPVQDGQLTGRSFDTRPIAQVRSAAIYGTFSAAETITIETEELLTLDPY